jgi:hypothetical protein
MLSNEEQQGLAGLSREELVRLWVLIQQVKAERMGGMPQSAIDDLVKAVPDKVVREVVADLRSGVGEPGWLPPTPAKKPEEKRSGPPREIPLGPPSGVEHCDRIAEHFAALDKRDLEKRLRGG